MPQSICSILFRVLCRYRLTSAIHGGRKREKKRKGLIRKHLSSTAITDLGLARCSGLRASLDARASTYQACDGILSSNKHWSSVFQGLLRGIAHISRQLCRILPGLLLLGSTAQHGIVCWLNLLSVSRISQQLRRLLSSLLFLQSPATSSSSSSLFRLADALYALRRVVRQRMSSCT